MKSDFRDLYDSPRPILSQIESDTLVVDILDHVKSFDKRFSIIKRWIKKGAYKKLVIRTHSLIASKILLLGSLPTIKSIESIGMTTFLADNELEHIGFDLHGQPEVLFSRLPQFLKSITLRNDDYRLNQKSVYNDFIIALSDNLGPKLLKLAIFVTVHDQVWVVENVLQECPNLLSLCLYINRNIDYSVLSKLPKLEHVEAWLRKPSELLEIIDKCSKLTKLVVFATEENLYQIKKYCHIHKLYEKHSKVDINVRSVLSDHELFRYHL